MGDPMKRRRENTNRKPDRNFPCGDHDRGKNGTVRRVNAPTGGQDLNPDLNPDPIRFMEREPRMKFTRTDRVSGLAAACAGALCVAGLTASASAGVPLTRTLVASASSPVYVTHAPGDTERVFVVERAGRLRIIENDSILTTPFLNITSDVDTFFEGGLLGLAFHPDYDTNGFFYVNYTRDGPPGSSLTTVIERFTVSAADANLADVSSRQVVLEVNQPAGNHNAGWLGFSPVDGFLYIPLGDGGNSGTSQNTLNLLGKVLRIDVNGDDFPGSATQNYAIPADNPFTGNAGIRDEVWSIGLRNPYRSAFDRETGDLYIADVGAGSWEEIDVEEPGPGGLNYGWPCMEGFACGFGGSCTCNDPSLTLPIQVYSHGVGCSVTGGSVYRGCAVPDLDGTYFYADFCTDRVWSLRYVDGEATEVTDRTSELSINSPSGFGEDANGEVYMCSLNGGVYRITSATPPPDKNGNGIADSCEGGILGDVDGDGDVDFNDVVSLLAAWGPCDGCPADFDGNGFVDFQDLLTVLAAWS